VKTLVIHTGAVSDVVLGLPSVVDYLHKVMRGVVVDVLISEESHEIVTGNPLIDRTFILPTRLRGRIFQAVREGLSLRDTLRARSYDMVFDIAGKLASGIACWSTGAEKRFGYTKDALRDPVNSLFTTPQLPLRREDAHRTTRCLRPISIPFGKDFRTMKLDARIYTSRDDEAAAEALLATLADGLVFMLDCGDGDFPDAAVQIWCNLVRSVLAEYAESTVLCCWDNDSGRSLAAVIAKEVGEGVRILPHYGIQGISALIKKVDVVIGVDSLPVHVAAVVGTPTVSLFEPSVAAQRAPRGEGHVVIKTSLFSSNDGRAGAPGNDRLLGDIRSGLKKIMGGT